MLADDDILVLNEFRSADVTLGGHLDSAGSMQAKYVLWWADMVEASVVYCGIDN